MKFLVVAMVAVLMVMSVSMVIAQEVPAPVTAEVEDNGPLDDVLHTFKVSDSTIQWITIILGALLALEQYLASTKRFSANSTFQTIGNMLKFLLGKKK
ncbi:MAG: hypothetical protein C4534_06090 [Gaiellales bacterium]|nr:MAG: hypothetical protein C4534_06090 [Gaiellales bacterium]